MRDEHAFVARPTPSHGEPAAQAAPLSTPVAAAPATPPPFWAEGSPVAASLLDRLPAPDVQPPQPAVSSDDDAGNRLGDFAFGHREQPWEPHIGALQAFDAETSRLSAFRGSIGQGFLDYANEVTMDNRQPPSWEHFAPAESPAPPDFDASTAACLSGNADSDAARDGINGLDLASDTYAGTRHRFTQGVWPNRSGRAVGIDGR